MHVLIRDRRLEDTERHTEGGGHVEIRRRRKGHVKTEAEIRAVGPQAKEWQGCLSHQELGRSTEHILPQSL